MRSLPTLNNQHSVRKAAHGFTLVEMLIVVPIALLVIAGIIAAMVAMVGDTVATNTRSAVAYNMQDTLNRIEQDARIAINFMDSYTLLVSPQGRGGGTTAYSLTAGDLIISQQATTANPDTSTRSLVYYAKQPAACTSTNDLPTNRALTTRAIYYRDSSGILWRHSQVSPNDQNGTVDPGTIGATTTCQRPWQRNSCKPIYPISADCQTYDEKLLDNVSAFTVTYYKSDGTQTTVPAQATTIKAEITVNKTAATKTISQKSSVRVTRINDIATDPKPLTPVVSLYNASDGDYNNSRLVSIQWSSTYAVAYGIQTRIGGGAWSAVNITTDPNTAIDVAAPGTTVEMKVTAYNDSGASATTTFNTASVQKGVCQLGNDWVAYGGGYASASFTRTSSDIVVMRGLIKNTAPTSGDVVCTLPEGSRPDRRLIFQTQTYNGSAISGRMDVNTNGDVIYVTGTGTNWISLDNIAFPVAGAYTWSGALTPSNSWTYYGMPYPDVTVAEDGVGRNWIQGLTKSGTTTSGATMYTLPSGDAPDAYDIYPTRCSVGSAVQLSTTGLIQARGVPCNGYLSTQIMYWPTGTTGWSNITLGASWVNYGGSYSTARYKKGSDGIVSLRGLIKSGTATSGTVIATLPNGYKPAENVICSLITYDATNASSDGARIDIASDGKVFVREGVLSNWVSLAGCNYYADGA